MGCGGRGSRPLQAWGAARTAAAPLDPPRPHLAEWRPNDAGLAAAGGTLAHGALTGDGAAPGGGQKLYIHLMQARDRGED